MQSNCCGASPDYRGHGLCSECKEACVPEEVDNGEDQDDREFYEHDYNEDMLNSVEVSMMGN